jgi:2'-5' RNA ligase
VPAPGMPGRAHAVVSLLDAATSDRVTGLWQGIDHRLGLRGIFVMPAPHFTYHVAGEYDRKTLEPALEDLSRTLAPFEVRTVGISSFDLPWPVVYIAVEVDPALRSLHERIWSLCSSHARESSPLYQPARWVPHISLAYGDESKKIPLSEGEVLQVKALLGKGEYRWNLRIDNIALVIDDGDEQLPVRTFALRGG